MDMSDDSVRKHSLPYFKILTGLAVFLLLSVCFFVLAGMMNLGETLFQWSQKFESLQLDEFLVVVIVAVFALAVLAFWLWHGLKREIRDYNMVEMSLHRANAKLALLNSIIREDMLNQLTELYGDMDHAGQKPDITKVKTEINRIRRQIKFTKEYQDIGTSTPEWQDIADTIMRAKVGVDLGKVTLDVEIRDMEIYADRLLEKAFFYLIDNALKHGGEKLSKIRFYSKLSEDKFVIVCHDDGMGIPADKKGLLFPKEFGRHAGYGLFQIKEILSVTDIGIKESGIPGEGARFEIHVPTGVYRKV